MAGLSLCRATALKGVLVIAVLLRLMDSFMIYTEPFVLTGGGLQYHHFSQPVSGNHGSGAV